MSLINTSLAGLAALFLFAAAPAEATPVTQGAAVTLAQDAPSLTQSVHYRRYAHRHGYRYGYRGHRYGYRRHYARPRVVCRVRYTQFGPRRVCMRRW